LLTTTVHVTTTVERAGVFHVETTHTPLRISDYNFSSSSFSLFFVFDHSKESYCFQNTQNFDVIIHLITLSLSSSVNPSHTTGESVWLKKGGVVTHIQSQIFSVPCSFCLRWDPWYQGSRGGVPCHPGTRAFFYFFIFIFWRELFFLGKKWEKTVFSLYFLLFLSLFLSFSVHTVWVLFSLIHFTKVSCEG
jgi:hypothetical protein